MILLAAVTAPVEDPNAMSTADVASLAISLLALVVSVIAWVHSVRRGRHDRRAKQASQVRALVAKYQPTFTHGTFVPTGGTEPDQALTAATLNYRADLERLAAELPDGAMRTAALESVELARDLTRAWVGWPYASDQDREQVRRNLANHATDFNASVKALNDAAARSLRDAA